MDSGGEAVNDLPFNAEQIYPLRQKQIIASSAVVGLGPGDMQAEVAPGESLQFTFNVFIGNQTTSTVKFNIGTPANPNGGFQIIGAGLCGSVFGTSYTADDFNNPVGALRGGPPATLLSCDVVTVTGNLANGAQPGLLSLTIEDADDLHVWPISHLQVKRIANARTNEVGA